MEWSNRNTSLIIHLIFILSLSGCGLINLNDESLEEYGRKVRVTMATLVTYIGKSKEDVKRDFGEPTEIRKPGWLAGEEYEELWYYIYRRGIPGINAEGSTKRFFFNQDKVVSVDAL
jgi:hypothetical protein